MKYHGILIHVVNEWSVSDYCSGMHDPIKMGGSGGGGHTFKRNLYIYIYLKEKCFLL